MKLTLNKKSLAGFMKVFTANDVYRNLPVYFLQEEKGLRVFVRVVREYRPDKGEKFRYDPFFISRFFPHEGGSGCICIKDAEKIEEICSETDEEEIVINCDTSKKKSLTVEFAIEDGQTYEVIDTCEAKEDNGDYPDINNLTEYSDKMVTYYGDGEIVHVVVADNTYATLEMYNPGDCQELSNIINILNPNYDPEFKKGENFMATARRAKKEEEKSTAQNAVEEDDKNEKSTDKKVENKEKPDKKTGKSDKNKKSQNKREESVDEAGGKTASEVSGGEDSGKEGDKEDVLAGNKVEDGPKTKKPKKKKRTKEEIERDNFNWCVEFLDERGYDTVKRDMSIEDALANIVKCVEVIRGEVSKPLDKDVLLQQLQAHLEKENK